MAENKSQNKPDNEGQVTETPDGTRVVRTVGRDFRVEGNDVDGYIGVSSEYRTYANPTERPYITEEEVTILVNADYPTDVERMTLESAGQAPGEPVADEETDTHPSKVLEEAGEGDKDEDGKSKSDAETAKAQGQGQAAGGGASADTRNAAGRGATGSSQASASTSGASSTAKPADKATENKK